MRLKTSAYDDVPCTICNNTGSIPVQIDGSGPPVYEMCKCALKREILANTDRGYHGLVEAPIIQGSSPLLDFLDKNVWITASKEWFLPHLRHVAVRQMPSWHFSVVSDAEMMTAWLANKAIDGMEIMDADVREEAATVSIQRLTLVDLVQPPTLMIARVGVKSARNSAMPEVFLEALMEREHADKPTWIWDQPDQPLAVGHLSYSDSVLDAISNWQRFDAKEWEGRNVNTTRVVQLKQTGITSVAAKPEEKKRNIRDIMMGKK